MLDGVPQAIDGDDRLAGVAPPGSGPLCGEVGLGASQLVDHRKHVRQSPLLCLAAPVESSHSFQQAAWHARQAAEQGAEAGRRCGGLDWLSQAVPDRH